MMPPPLFYYREYQENGPGHNNPFAQQLSDLRRQNDLLVVQHIRQLWKTGGDQWNLKGNDQLIRGYALFLQQHPDYKSQLVLFEYGTDVDETKKLIAELGISHAVTWLPKMQRKYLVDFIRSSDVVVGELFHSWNSYCVVAETLAFGKVLLHKRTDADFRDVYEKLYPMIHASSAASVAEGLLRVASDKNSMERMGQEGKAWFLEYCVQKPLGVIRELIQRKEALHA